MNPIDIAINNGMAQDFVQNIRNTYENNSFINYFTECLAGPQIK
jgi:hypothetical protein